MASNFSILANESDTLSNEPMLRIENLSVQFRGADNPSLNALSLHLHRGETLAVLGESGSGKSTLARALCGCLPSDARVTGQMQWREASPSATTLSATRFNDGLAMVFQDALATLHPMRSLQSQLHEILALRLRSTDAINKAARKLWLQVQLDLALLPRFPHQLSGGQRQRAAIALALATAPKILIADEATSALDPITADAVMTILLQITKQHDMGLILITHHLDLAKRHANRLIVFQNGNVVEAGEASECLSNPRSQALQALCAATPTRAQAREGSHAGVGASTCMRVSGVRVTHARGVRPSVRDANLNLHRGQVFGLAGGSGSGKSTLARAICNLIAVDEGQIDWLDGANQAAPSSSNQAQLDSRPSRLQMVFQDPAASLDPRWRVMDQLAEPFLLRKKSLSPTRAIELLQAVGLGAEHLHRLPHELSGGQKQRVAIARALACDPDVLICDEATSALDPTVQAQIVQLLLALCHSRGLSLVLVAHDLRLLAAHCDQLAIMFAGEIVEQGEVADILQQPKHPHTSELLRASGLGAFADKTPPNRSIATPFGERPLSA